MIEPSSTTALHPPAPAPCAATSAARRAPPPRSRTALGFARSALGARPRVGREGESAFRTHTRHGVVSGLHILVPFMRNMHRTSLGVSPVRVAPPGCYPGAPRTTFRWVVTNTHLWR